MTIKETIAANLKRLRKEKGWTQQYVADSIYRTRDAYIRYEYANVEPPLEVMNMLARLYKTTVDNLINLNTEV
jgi:transcriptional regulator with XRE-family HTH domain